MHLDRSTYCPGCNRTVSARQMMVVGRLTDRCEQCRHAPTTPSEARPKRIRMLQTLRHVPASDLNDREATTVAAARVIANRRWDMRASTQAQRWDRAQTLHAALFVAGCDVTAGNYQEAARLAGRVIIDFVPGDAGAVTERLMLAAAGHADADAATLLITDAWLPPAAVDAFERYARRAIGVYPQTREE